MTVDRDVERVLDHWLVQGVNEMPDRVYLSILDRVERQPQQPAWRLLPWRFPTVSTAFRLVLIGASLVAALVAGSLFFAGGGVTPAPTPTPTASPTATAAPTPTASPSAVFPAWFRQGGSGAGILPAGGHTTRQFLRGSAFTVPAGWVNESDGPPVFTLFPDTPANEAEYALSEQTAQNVLLTDRVANNMFAICDATGPFHGATASEVIDGVQANPAFRFWTSEPVDVTIGGLSGRQVDLQISKEWAGRCTLNPKDPPTRDYTDARMRLIVLDRPSGGPIGIAVSSLHSAAFEAFLAEAMPVVESFRFDVVPGASPTLGASPTPGTSPTPGQGSPSPS